ncbi:MAG: hypothetical protein ACYC3G_03405 [Minisyncoccota bacterium]
MTKKTIIISLVCLVVVVGAFLFLSKRPSSGSNSDLVIFYSDNCSHCLNLEKFLEENKVSEKVVYTRKSVDNDQTNVAELLAKASKCGIKDGVGIPLLWDGENSRCLMGDVDVINFFKEKII